MTTSSRIFDSLTEAQSDAVAHVDGALLILAGPGSGKTRVVTHRIAYMVEQGIHPGMILALTFTNKAADEMKDRVQRLAPGASVWIGTFHRFCSRLLRQHAPLVGLDSNFTIYDMSDSKQALKRAIDSLEVSITHTSTDAIANQISWLKNHLVMSDTYEPRGEPLSAITKQVYPAYQEELIRSNAVDFDDLLLHVATLLQQSPELRAALDEAFRYVMVDEYQDTNLAQYAIVRALSNDYPNLAVTGDPDQSIYGWRGANLRNILDFETDFPQVKVVRLEQNYRSTPNILSAAQALISNNRLRKQKALFTDNPAGAPVRLAVYPTNREEADEIASEVAQQIQAGAVPADFAVFYRVNSISRALEDAFRTHGIPYQIVNGVEFYKRREVKDVLAYLQLIHNPKNNSALARIINVPPRRIGKTTVNRLVEYARNQRLPLLETVVVADEVETLSKLSRSRLRAFAELIDRLSQYPMDCLEQVIGLILTETRYREYLEEATDDADQDRLANLDELLSAAREFDECNEEPDAVSAFLEQAALVNDTDALAEQSNVNLMTLHSAKGLEFSYVYVVGVEQGLLPHERSLNMPEEEEEERRLLFVGMTRAKQRLQLSRVVKRARMGGLFHTVPSSFLLELPRDEMDLVDLTGRIRGLPELHDDEVVFDVNEVHEEVDFDQAPDVDTTPQDVEVEYEPPPLQTASQWMAGDDAAQTEVSGESLADPNAFRIGMTVVHPEYGPGKVAALSGQGKQRTGTIRFAAVGEKRIILAYSQLRPFR